MLATVPFDEDGLFLVGCLLFYLTLPTRMARFALPPSLPTLSTVLVICGRFGSLVRRGRCLSTQHGGEGNVCVVGAVASYDALSAPLAGAGCFSTMTVSTLQYATLCPGSLSHPHFCVDHLALASDDVPHAHV